MKTYIKIMIVAMLSIILIFIILELGTIELTEKEKDLILLRKAMDSLLCVSLDHGICFCRNRDEMKFSTHHCSLLLDAKIYKFGEVFPEKVKND